MAARGSRKIIHQDDFLPTERDRQDFLDLHTFSLDVMGNYEIKRVDTDIYIVMKRFGCSGHHGTYGDTMVDVIVPYL